MARPPFSGMGRWSARLLRQRRTRRHGGATNSRDPLPKSDCRADIEAPGDVHRQRHPTPFGRRSARADCAGSDLRCAKDVRLADPCDRRSAWCRGRVALRLSDVEFAPGFVERAPAEHRDWPVPSHPGPAFLRPGLAGGPARGLDRAPEGNLNLIAASTSCLRQPASPL